MTISDSYFEIGKSHQICQDYALSGTLDGMTYAIISDGCSAAKNSEIGAQILCYVAKYNIEILYKTGAFKDCSIETLSNLLESSIIKRADEIRKLYSINPGVLQATLIILVSCFGKIYQFMWGDGVIIIKGVDGKVSIKDFEYPSGAPVYLVTNKEQYKREIEDQRLICTTYYEDKTGEFSKEKELDPFKSYCNVEYDKDIYSITVCSDGIKTFQDEKFKSIKLTEMASEFINYKSDSGAFVQRCMNFLKRNNVKRQWSHYDDISCGTVLLKK